MTVIKLGRRLQEVSFLTAVGSCCRFHVADLPGAEDQKRDRETDLGLDMGVG